MPKILNLDSNAIRKMTKEKPGEYGRLYTDAMETAMRRFGGYKFDSARFDQTMGWYPAEMARIRSDEAYLVNTCRMDDNLAAFFARQLEFIKARTYDVEYPKYMAQYYLPISNEAGPGAEYITARQFDSRGRFQFSSKNSQTAPRIDVVASEGSVSIKSLEASYGYTIQEIRNAMYAGLPLEQRKANAARLAYDQSVNEIGWFADGSAQYEGVRGLFYAQNVLNSADSSLGVTLNGNWCDQNGHATSTTQDQIIADINTIINFPFVFSRSVERVNTLLLPVAKYAYLSSTPRSSLSDTTLLKFLKDQHPDVTFGPINEAANVIRPSNPTGSARTDIAIALNLNPDKLTLEIPQPFEQFPVVFTGKEYVTTCHYRIAGVMVYKPKSIFIAEGI